jgi:hypothetical protein
VDLADLQALYDRHWTPSLLSVTPDEMLYFQDLIAAHRPRRFLEIGTASGMSGGLIALLLEEHGGESLTTLDHDNTFFGDPTKENGFLLEEVYRGDKVRVDKRPFTVSMDLPALGREYDMAFIDANHQHPWPTIDTLCTYPFLTGSKVVLHHDLKLYKEQDVPRGIGPKYLYDQFPEHLRDRSPANHGNLFSVSLDLDRDAFETVMMDALSLPWSVLTHIQPPRAEAIRRVLDAYYSPGLRDVFDRSMRRFNRPISERWPNPEPEPREARRRR